MSEQPHGGDNSGSSSILQRVDRLCERFQAAWAADQRPRIEDYLEYTLEPERSLLLRELLRLELVYRRQRHETVGPDEYQRRFPVHADLIQAAFAELVAAEGSGEAVSSEHQASTGPEAEGPAGEEQPAVLGRYRITARLGAGGFGIVYQAYDEDLRRHVAIKVPHRQRVMRSEDVEAYLAEAQILASLDHPHIVPVHDFGRTDDGLCYVVSKFIEGCDLAKQIKKARPSHALSAELLATVADALHYAHRQGLVHRDIKPGNILLDTNGKSYVGDFGLALKEEDFGRGSTFAGTPAYMSPEQARGEGHRVDGRSDIFSLGVVFYELLTGRRPFKGETRDELLEQIIAVEARPPRQVDDRIPMELERICLKALAKRASERYTTAKDMAEDLRHFLTQFSQQQSVVAGSVVGAAPTTVPVSAPTSPPSVKIVPKGLRSFDAKDADFFLELLPGARDREGLPESIRFWKSRIEETDPERTFSVGLLYGASGCGKSSLLKAGLLPRLAPHVVPIYIESTARETEFRLLRALHKHCPDLPADLGLIAGFATLRRGRFLPGNKKVLLVLDQFEQWLHVKRGEENTELVQAFRQCDGQRVQAIVLVRDDFGMAATRFLAALEIPIVQGQNFAMVDLFDLLHARKVLAEFGRAFGRLPDNLGMLSRNQERFLDRAIAGLSQDGRIVPVRLALFAEMVKGKPWVPGTLKTVGGMEGIGVRFLEETFEAVTAPPQHRLHKRAAQAVLKALLSASGTDIKSTVRSHETLLAASGYAARPGEFDALLRILDGELRLLTPSDPEEPDSQYPLSQTAGGTQYYQLTHDFLVPSLRAWLTRKQKETKRGSAEVCLEERTTAWSVKPERRNLPGWWEWVNIRCFTSKKNWTDPERKLMREADRHHALRGLALTGLLAVATLMGLFTRGSVTGRMVDRLYEELLVAEPHKVPEILERLDPYKDKELMDQFWSIVEQPDGGNERKRLRAACALARYDPNNPRNAKLRAPLLVVFRDHKPERTAERSLVTKILADYVVDPDVLADLLMDADEDQFAVLFLKLNEYAELGAKPLLAELDKQLQPPEEEKNRLARRQANAAVALSRLGQAEKAWPLLKHSPDPRVRSYLLHRLGSMGADPKVILQQLDAEKEVSIRRALLLSLGDFDLKQLPVASRRAVSLRRLLDLYRTDPDPGLHGAMEWLLRQCQADEMLREIDEELATGKVEGKRQWYINRQGQTMMVIPGPVEFMMGSPPTEAGRLPEELLHRRRIGRTFALSAKLVTVQQFLRFRSGHAYSKEHAPTLDCPILNVSWYDAAGYCNWLSEQEGLPESEWCYQPIKDRRASVALGASTVGLLASLHGQAALLAGSSLVPGRTDAQYAYRMQLAPDYLQRRGYRLPTEAEWEYACRAGAVTSRYYGESEELLGKYAWYVSNSAKHSWPVGNLKPNDFGLFDMHGNVWTWCQERPRKYPLGLGASMVGLLGSPLSQGHFLAAAALTNEVSLSVNSRELRLLRGGSFTDQAGDVRSAARYGDLPAHRLIDVGLRPARTLSAE